MTSMTHRTASVHDGASLAYEDHGRAELGTLVLLHSLGADCRMWDGCLESLIRHQRVILPDTRGHGASSPAPTSSVDEWVVDLDDVLDAAEVDTAVLVGVSLGGMQALAYAAAHPSRVAGLVVADSFVALAPDVAQAKIHYLCDQGRRQSMADVAAQYVADTFEQPYPAGAETVRRAFAAMDSASYIAAVKACFGVQIEDRLTDVMAPTLVLWGDRDAKTPRALSEQIVAGVKDARLAVVPDAGHLSNVDNPAGFVDELTVFTTERCARPARLSAERGN